MYGNGRWLLGWVQEPSLKSDGRPLRAVAYSTTTTTVRGYGAQLVL